jgi:hypothetical protein
MPAKLTKKQLLQQMDEKLQALNLLYSALQNQSNPKQEDLENYQKQFNAQIGKKK